VVGLAHKHQPILLLLLATPLALLFLALAVVVMEGISAILLPV
jgi:hypothetical protein